MSQSSDIRPGEGISVSGSGSAMGPPDVVRVRIAASVARPRLTDALAASEAAAKRVREALARYKVAGHDAATASLSVVAEQAWSEKEGPRVTGFRAEHAIAITVRDVPSLGPLLGDALAAGGDDVRLDGVEFAVENDADLRRRARDAAWADAASRAEQLAGLAGRRLGQVLDILEGGSLVRPPLPVAAYRLAAAADTVSVEPGRVGVDVALSVRWALA